MKSGRDQHISESAQESHGCAAWPKHTLAAPFALREGKRTQSCPEGRRKPWNAAGKLRPQEPVEGWNAFPYPGTRLSDKTRTSYAFARNKYLSNFRV